MLSQFSWVAAGRVIAALLQVLSLGLVAAWTDPGSFGLLAAMLGIAVIPQTLFDFGISTYVTRARAEDPSDPSVTFALRINNKTSILLALVLGIGILLCAFFVSAVFWFMLPLAIWAGSQRNADVWAAVALADGDAYVNTVSLVGRRLLTVLIQATFLLLALDPILGFSVGSAISATVSALYVRRKVASRLSAIDSEHNLRSLLRMTWPYWLHSAATQVRNVDTALVALIAAPAAAGMYAVASRVTGPLRILPLSLAAVLLPGLSRNGGRLSRRVVLGIIGVLTLLTLMYGTLAAAAGWLVPTLLGSAYEAAILPVQIVCLGLVFGAAASLLASILQSRGLQKSAGFISTATAVFCVFSIAIGANFAGAAGAAVGLTASFALQAILMLAALILARGKS